MRVLIKLLLSAAVITLASEAARRSPRLGGLIIALPLSSLLALYFLRYDGGDTAKTAAFCAEILKMILPTLLFFLALPPLLRAGWNFHLAIAASLALMFAGMGAWWLLANR
jgi:F0F1-type ATP synthase assembly protein I